MKSILNFVTFLLVGILFLCPFPQSWAQEKLLPQTNFMIPIVVGSTNYFEVPFTPLHSPESKYTVSITKKLPENFSMKIELNHFSMQEKFDVGPIKSGKEGTFGIRVFCSDQTPVGTIETAKILIGSVENSRLSSIVNVFVQAMPQTEMTLYTTNANAIVNGEKELLETPPLVQQGRTLVPFRWIGEKLGSEVSFTMSEETKKVDTVSYTIGKETITLTIGSTEVTTTINREEIKQTLDVPPFIKNGRTFVPLRFVSETLGASVTWTPPNTIGMQYPKIVPVREGECATFWTEISAEDLKESMEEGKEFFILDVRDLDTYHAGHIPGAVQIDFALLATELPPATETMNKPVLVYCKSGTYSKQAAEWIVNQGYPTVFSLSNGFASWDGEIEISK